MTKAPGDAVIRVKETSTGHSHQPTVSIFVGLTERPSQDNRNVSW